MAWAPRFVPDRWASTRVKVRLPNGADVYVAAFFGDTVALLRQFLVAREPDLGRRAFSLHFKGRVLNDDDVLSRCGIALDSVVEFRPVMPVTVLTPRGRLSLSVAPSDTVDAFLHFLAQQCQFSDGDFTLALKDRDLPADQTLDACGVVGGSVLELRRVAEFTLTITLPDGCSGSIPARSNQQVSDVEATIIAEDILPAGAAIRLVFDSVLLDHDRALRHYRIEGDATLHVVTTNPARK
jgi:hypothetical protein